MILARLALPLLASCTYTHIRTGDDNLWRAPLGFEKGTTTVVDVLRELGPPTQMYDFGARTAFFYMLGENRNQSINLVVYKETERRYVHDRAVYFFDRDGVLEEMATSTVALPREDEYLEDPWQDIELRGEGDG